eukprot:UN02010
MAKLYDLLDQDTIPLNYFTKLLSEIPVDSTITIKAKSSTVIKRAVIFAGLSIKDTQVDGDVTTYTVTRPNKEKLQSKPIAAAAPAPVAAPAGTSWGIDPNVKAATVDEGELLANTVTETKEFDCGTGEGPRKACKNCTCGLADQEVAEAQQAEQKKGSGGCGNCALGDAYRCAGCPSLGKPAWETVTGEKIKLNAEDPSLLKKPKNTTTKEKDNNTNNTKIDIYIMHI